MRDGERVGDIHSFDTVCVKRYPQDCADCSHEDSLARARLAGDDIQSVIEGYVNIVRDGQIVDVQFQQHRQPPQWNLAPRTL